MMYSYVRGYKVIFDSDKMDWVYEDSGEILRENPRPCKKCGNNAIEDGDLECDYCLGNLGDKVAGACCGHGVEKGFILFKDGRYFEEKKHYKRKGL